MDNLKLNVVFFLTTRKNLKNKARYAFYFICKTFCNPEKCKLKFKDYIRFKSYSKCYKQSKLQKLQAMIDILDPNDEGAEENRLQLEFSIFVMIIRNFDLLKLCNTTRLVVKQLFF